jgi:hypothetical protein
VPYFGNYAQQYRASFRSGEIRILDSTGNGAKDFGLTRTMRKGLGTTTEAFEMTSKADSGPT